MRRNNCSPVQRIPIVHISHIARPFTASFSSFANCPGLISDSRHWRERPFLEDVFAPIPPRFQRRVWVVYREQSIICNQAEDRKEKNIPHIIQPGSPLPLRGLLHDFHTLYIRAVDLNPHLATDLRQLVPKQERSIDTPCSNIQTHA